MSKNRRKQQRPRASGSANRSTPPKARNLLRHWKSMVAVLLFASVSVGGLAAYKQNWESTHDLSVIGNGIPTVVQVHDPSCPLCQELKSNTRAALRQVDGDIQYRIADLTTARGASLARRHDARKVTLLTFDADGKFLNDYEGVMRPETIARLLEAVATPRDG